MPPPNAAAPQHPAAPPITFSNSYARLPEHFFVRINPTPVAAPQLIKLNLPLAEYLNLDLDFLASPQGIAFLAGNHIASGAEPIALAYAGHQFGHFVPQLGDGRANLLGEVIARDGLRYDLQLKGSGPSPFSRRGDGRAALGPVLREYLLSEAMAALDVPTTRALAALTTGQHVLRETPQPGAIFTRVAQGHLRVGTFQYFAARGDIDALRRLTNYAIARNYPELAASDTARPTRAFLQAAVGRQANLIAHWMLLGFVHGVMNTDNMAISGETIDYGPCAFLEAYHPATVFSSIDAQGRYSYANQPPAAVWNLTRLAETLLPLLEQEEGTEAAAITAATEALGTFDPTFQAAHLAGLRRKLGLLTDQPTDAALAQDLLTRMAANRADFTLTFRTLTHAAASLTHGLVREPDTTPRKLFNDPTAYDTWATTWHHRLAQEPDDPTTVATRTQIMQQANPAIIPRNHLVEAVIVAATQREDFQPFEALLEATANPFTDRPDADPYSQPATLTQIVHHTFCGT